MNHTNLISIALALVIMLFAPVQQAAAWGEVGHYGIVRDSGMNSDAALGGGVAPDAFLDALYGTNNIDDLAHTVIVGSSKYNPLSYDLYNVSNGIGTSKEWAIQFTGHTNADPSANDYALAAGGDTLSAHFIAEFAADILTYWSTLLEYGKIMPESAIVYPDQIQAALSAYDTACETDYLDNYSPIRYSEAFTKLQAVIIAERAVIDFRKNNKIDFTDGIYLKWAKYKYGNFYEEYYPKAENIDPTNFERRCPDARITSAMSTKSKTYRSEIAGIKMHIGKKLIDNELIKPHKRSDQKSGAIIIDFEQTVSDEKLAKAYEQYLEEAYEEQTGERVNILEIIRSEGKRIKDKDKQEK